MSKKHQDIIRCQLNAFCKRVIENAAKDLREEYARRDERECFIEELPPMKKEKLMSIEVLPEEEEIYYLVGGYVIGKTELHGFIRSLPKDRLEMIILHYFRGLSDAEAGEKLNISKRNANYRKNRGEEDILEKIVKEHGSEKRKK